MATVVTEAALVEVGVEMELVVFVEVKVAVEVEAAMVDVAPSPSRSVWNNSGERTGKSQELKNTGVSALLVKPCSKVAAAHPDGLHPHWLPSNQKDSILIHQPITVSRNTVRALCNWPDWWGILTSCAVIGFIEWRNRRRGGGGTLAVLFPAWLCRLLLSSYRR